jgi:D-sedoheptulose 7-phosphate isomerase
VVEDALVLPGSTSSVQEAQLIAVHVLCEVFETALRVASESRQCAL